MTETVITSEKQKVVLGFDRRFVMIGERINPTGRKLLAEEMARGDYSRVVADALAQVAAGAQMLDVNAGIPLADEPKILAECIKLVQETVPVPLSIDSSIACWRLSSASAIRGKASLESSHIAMTNTTSVQTIRPIPGLTRKLPPLSEEAAVMAMVDSIDVA